MADLATPPVVRIRWTATCRLIPSRYPSVGLFDTIASPDDLDAILELEAWTIEEKIDLVRASLEAREPAMFGDLFAGSRSRLEVIVTFMAILELLKHGQARVQQEGTFGSIWIYKGDNFGKPMGEVADWSTELEGSGEVNAPVEEVEDAFDHRAEDWTPAANDDTELTGEADGEPEPR